MIDKWLTATVLDKNDTTTTAAGTSQANPPVRFNECVGQHIDGHPYNDDAQVSYGIPKSSEIPDFNANFRCDATVLA